MPENVVQNPRRLFFVFDLSETLSCTRLNLSYFENVSTNKFTRTHRLAREVIETSCISRSMTYIMCTFVGISLSWDLSGASDPQFNNYGMPPNNLLTNVAL